MIYTIGARESIIQALKKSSETGFFPKVLGPRNVNGTKFDGIIAFKEIDHARNFIKENPLGFSGFVSDKLGIFSIDGTWDDVYYDHNESFHRIKKDMNILEYIE